MGYAEVTGGAPPPDRSASKRKHWCWPSIPRRDLGGSHRRREGTASGLRLRLELGLGLGLVRVTSEG
eukprot:scaffold33213_cov60-Phaeocystis_antarctica.AAC.3